jgi:hydrogenase maturation protease
VNEWESRVLNVLRITAAMNAKSKHVALVGCEPLTFGGEKGGMDFSEPIVAAVEEAVEMVTAVVDRVLQQGQQRTNQVI